MPTYGEKIKGEQAILNPVCPVCNLKRAQSQYIDNVGRHYVTCDQCRSKRPELRQPMRIQ